MTQFVSECAKYFAHVEKYTPQQAAALWCGVDPMWVGSSATRESLCYSIKLQVIEDAIEHDKLPAVNVSTHRFADDRDKRDLRIRRADLRAWFESLPFDDKPAFLFEESQAPDLSESEEMAADKALAMMAWLLATGESKYKIGERPNVDRIVRAVETRAKAHLGENARGFSMLQKRLSRALKTLPANAFSLKSF